MVKIGIDLNNIEFSVSPASASVLPTGESAPEFSLEDLDGNEVRLADQRGQVVLVNFWATWCGPCLQELLNIQQIHEKYQDQGLVVLAISTDHQKSAVRPFVEKNGYTFPVLFVDFLPALHAQERAFCSVLYVRHPNAPTVLHYTPMPTCARSMADAWVPE
jgi:thiol-disulfide isomerase/thioredoxin